MFSKNVLITGSARGIGRHIALHLANLGYNIALNGVHSEASLLLLSDQIKEYGVKVYHFLGDVGNYDTANEFYQKATDALGDIGIVINNAGIAHVGLFQDMTLEQWNSIVNTNLTSVYNICHAAIPTMVRNHEGIIINISSMWGICGASCEVAYSATKGAINSLTKALGKELAPSNIQVNAIACGAIDTDMNHMFSEDELKALAYDIPAGRLGDPKEVAKMVELLINSPKYLNGEVIKMDGGYI